MVLGESDADTAVVLEKSQGFGFWDSSCFMSGLPGGSQVLIQD